MAFPTTVRADIAVGFVGDLAFEGPLKAEPAVLNSADAANNVIGRAFTGTGTDGEAQAGGDGYFIGILANKAEYTTAGTAAGGALAPSTTLRNGEVGDFVRMTPGIFVTLSNAFNVGDYVTYTAATGALNAIAQNAVLPGSQRLIPGASVVRYSSATSGLAIISLSDDLVPATLGAP